MIFFELLFVALGSFFYGVLLAAVTIAIMYFVLQMISKTCVKTVSFYISMAVLAVLLIVQDTFLIAAFRANDMVSAAEILIQQHIGSSSQALNMEQVQNVLDMVVREIPLLGVFVNITNVQVDNAQDLATEMAAVLHNYLNAYIWRRIGWCGAFIVVAVLITFFADKRNIKATPSTGRRATVRTSDRHIGRGGRRHRF